MLIHRHGTNLLHHKEESCTNFCCRGEIMFKTMTSQNHLSSQHIVEYTPNFSQSKLAQTGADIWMPFSSFLREGP